MTDRFPICLPFTLAQECPYTNSNGVQTIKCFMSGAGG
jgi:hypothetical protein